MSPLVDLVRASALADRFRSCTILIVGDVMLDHFVFGRVHRISPEAPVPVVEFDHEHVRLGGAANVAHNARVLGARVELVGVVGTDTFADVVRQELHDLGIDASGVLPDERRPTTRKMRVVTTRNQQVARIDYESDGDVDGAIGRRVADAAAARAAGADVVVVSDYLKGVVTSEVMEALREVRRSREVPLLVDPKIPHLTLYADASLITPNHHEAEVATALRIRSDVEASRAAREFRRRAACDSVLVTRGEHGMWLLEGQRDRDATEPVRELALPASAREVADVTGAGDTVIATMAVSLAAGASLTEGAALANYAAGVSVAKFGPAAVTPAELLHAVDADPARTLTPPAR